MKQVFYEVLALRQPREGYGLLALERTEGVWRAAAACAPVTERREDAARLAALCTALQLSPIHLPEVTADFQQQALAAGLDKSPDSLYN
ncbi:MAG: hypothetical protein HFF17_01460 [Oscillospiraceae bacterium]|nr:hypothetical protein [Oscillospiraceae bacterium]